MDWNTSDGNGSLDKRSEGGDEVETEVNQPSVDKESPVSEAVPGQNQSRSTNINQREDEEKKMEDATVDLVEVDLVVCSLKDSVDAMDMVD